jgi:hypothetical protein
MNKLIPVDGSQNTYSFEYINCFEKPLGIILHNYGEMYPGIFHLYLKLIQCYKINGFEASDIFYTVGFNKALKYVIEDVLKFRTCIKTCEVNGLHSVIKGCIDQGIVALVPGNLKLFYNSPYYGVSNWQHLFLVNGYDEDKEVYYLSDSNHSDGNNGQNYKSLVFGRSYLEALFQAAKESFHLSCVWGICREDGNKKSERELLMNLLDMYLHQTDRQPYYEVDYIERINREIREGRTAGHQENDYEIVNSIDFIFLRSVKYKETFYNELLHILQRYGADQDKLDRIRELERTLLKQWLNLANNALVFQFLKRQVDLYDDIFDCIETEKNMKLIIADIGRELEHMESQVQK